MLLIISGMKNKYLSKDSFHRTLGIAFRSKIYEMFIIVLLLYHLTQQNVKMLLKPLIAMTMSMVRLLQKSWGPIVVIDYRLKLMTMMVIAIVLPFISSFIVAFDVVNGGDAVEATNSEDHVVDNFDGKVTARIVHVGDWRPRVSSWIVHFTAAHS